MSDLPTLKAMSLRQRPVAFAILLLSAVVASAEEPGKIPPAATAATAPDSTGAVTFVTTEGRWSLTISGSHGGRLAAVEFSVGG